jgi:two-component system, chemotaxis family, sensor kinase CheA
MVDGKNDLGREEFLTEAQELVERMSRDLLLLDQAQRAGETHPEVLNDLFRGVHTLKGLSGMFGFHGLGRLAHILEDLLEHLRMGRAEVGTAALDVLFQGIEGFQRLLAEGDSAPGFDFDAFAERVRGATARGADRPDVFAEYDFDPVILSVLTEYEEHRLRAQLERGHTVYRFRLRLPLDVLDTTFEELKRRISGMAEVISYLPSLDSQGDDALDVELLLASAAPEAQLRAALNRPDGTLIAMRKRPAQSPAARASFRPALTAPAPPPASPDPASPPEPEARVRVAAQQLSLRSLTNVVRVEIRKLDHLMNVVGELGTVRSAFGRLLERMRTMPHAQDLVLEAQRVARSLDRRLGEVQDAVLDVRMVPLSQVFDKLGVVVRQLAREQDKQVQLQVRGAETEVDKLIAEDIADPLVHLVRNAVDHGVELPEQRTARGKPAMALLSIEAYQKGNQVVIEVRDDGRGIDTARVRQAAIHRGVMTEQQTSEMSRQELLHLIFLPGFSTRAQASDISGRGVGMDVVKTNVQRLGGAVEVESEDGQGTKLTITLPITLAIISALLFSSRGRTLSIPLAAVQEVVRLEPAAVRTIEGKEVLDLRGATLPLCRLGPLFYGAASAGDAADEHVIVLFMGNRRLGVIVDRLLGQEDIVIKPLGASLSSVRGIAGATDVGERQLVLVVDPAALLDEFLTTHGARLALGGQA